MDINTSDESYFPIIIIISHSGELALINAPGEIPLGIPFVVAQTKATERDLETAFQAVISHKNIFCDNPRSFDK